METTWKRLSATRGDSMVSSEGCSPLFVRVRRFCATYGDRAGTFCKPEVAGSIPARSIKYLQIDIFCCLYRRDFDPTARPWRGLKPVKAARSRECPVAASPADQAGVHRVTGPDCRDFPT
jgi:hypothetical protein